MLPEIPSTNYIEQEYQNKLKEMDVAPALAELYNEVCYDSKGVFLYHWHRAYYDWLNEREWE